MSLETCSNHVLVLVSVSLTLLQDINSSQDKESGYKYVPQLSRIENHRGCPRLEIKLIKKKNKIKQISSVTYYAHLLCLYDVNLILGYYL